MLSRTELISLYLNFFKSKSHKIIPPSSLIPENDPSVLFTTAGMHPLVPYLLGQRHPLGKTLVGVQKCLRTQDIDKVGNETHHTFFEMLGNWSLGDYWKKQAIEYSYEFLTKILKLKKEELAVTCFKGNKDAKKDIESEQAWKSLGIKKIKFLGKEDNWWGPAGSTGPCGPDTEMFVNGVEIWNDVFMEYEKTFEGKFIKAKQKNVDTGMGVERTLAILSNLKDNYETEIFQPIINVIEKISNKSYSDEKNKKAMRIIADHIRASVFILGDDKKIIPSNVQHGYVLRRLIRRAIRYGKLLGINHPFTFRVAESVIPLYPDYPELKKNKQFIIENLKQEELRFSKTLESGLRIFERIIKDKKSISGKDAFLLFQSYGFPIELTQELAEEKNIKVEAISFDEEYKKHQELSKTSSAGMFRSGLADSSEKTTRLHTATHLLNEALRRVLGKEVKQRGSNITPERLRFDFNFPRKLTNEETKQVENLVNEKVKENLQVTREETSLKQAIKEGAQAEFGHKYPEKVSVYTIGNFSKEICTGPHVKNTKSIGKFKIIKEESVAAGIRRIKAIIQ